MGKKKRRTTVVRQPNRTNANKKSSAVAAVSQPTLGYGVVQSNFSPVKGIQNSGNTCFFNSVLQALNACSISHDKEGGGLVNTLLGETLANLRSPASGKPYINASGLLNALGNKARQFKSRNQQDSHELFVTLISQIHDEYKASRSNDGPSQENYAKAFDCNLASVVTCSACRYQSCTVETQANISLELPGSHLLAVPPVSEHKDRKKKKKAAVVVVEAAPEPAMKSNDEDPSAVAVLRDSLQGLSLDGGVQGALEAVPNGSENNSEDDEEEEEEEEEPVPVFRVDEPRQPPAHAVFSQEHDIAALKSDSSGEISLLQCLEHFTRTEQLLVSGGNGYACSSCRRQYRRESRREKAPAYPVRDATRRLFFVRAPPKVFVLHLKRLLPGGKMTVSVRFPLELDLSALVGSVQKEEEGSGDGENAGRHVSSTGVAAQWAFDLAAVICHSGGMHGGHYTSFVKRIDQSSPAGVAWYYTSDTSVKKSSEKDVLSCQAYMLFYERRDSNVLADQIESEAISSGDLDKKVAANDVNDDADTAGDSEERSEHDDRSAAEGTLESEDGEGAESSREPELV
jgi:ubiquitin C-terminal hydrolase